VGFEDLALSGAQAFGLGSPNRPFAGAKRQPRAPRARGVCVIYKKPRSAQRAPLREPVGACADLFVRTETVGFEDLALSGAQPPWA